MIAVADRRLLLPPNLAVPLSPWIVLAKSAVPASCPVDITEDILATISLPGGAMGANGILRVTTLWTVTNSANNKTLRSRLGGIGGTDFMGITFTAVATLRHQVQIQNRNAQNSQVGMAPVQQTFTTSAGAVLTGVIDTSAAQTLVITGQKALNSETITLESYLVELLYGA